MNSILQKQRHYVAPKGNKRWGKKMLHDNLFLFLTIGYRNQK